MKKAFDWLLKMLGVVFISVTVVPCLIGLLLGGIFVFCVGVLGMDLGPDKDARAIAALENTGLTAYTIAAPYHATTIDDSLTAFITCKYDNHEDNTNLRDGIMSAVAELPNWHVEAMSCDAYAAKLNAVYPEAAFLLPVNVIFDAWYDDADQLAFFDHDTGLMVHLQPEKQPRAGSIKADGLKVPHNGFVYEYESHGGFHGDGETWQALIVPEDKRAAFVATLARHADWQAGTVTLAEYAPMFDDLSAMLPASNVTFDWWCYVNDYARQYPEKEQDKDVHPGFPSVMREVGAVFSLNWHIALYDADTGLLIYYELDC